MGANNLDRDKDKATIVANSVLKALSDLKEVSNRDIANGLTTLLFSCLSVSHKNDVKNFNKDVDIISKALKKRYSEKVIKVSK